MGSMSTYPNDTRDSLENSAFLKAAAHDEEDATDKDTLGRTGGRHRIHFLWIVLAVQIIFIVTGIVYFVKEARKSSGNPQMLYSARYLI